MIYQKLKQGGSSPLHVSPLLNNTHSTAANTRAKSPALARLRDNLSRRLKRKHS